MSALKLWIKISSENRRQGAWFYDLEYARKCARSFERIIPIELKDWPDTQDDADHSHNGEYAGELVTDIMDACYREGLRQGQRMERESAEREEDSSEDICTGGGKSPRDPSFNPNHDFEGTDTCRQCGASKYNEPEDDDE